ncbi:hypothetical protein ANS017_13540 [Paraclostridium bifermentans]|uniref:hypothetical protein n=1 Tax=Paraclostridium bifermentans TaxID=1490 RepID=UPI001F468D3B|nr:hypothetical protein [Paraclostridium bifermentans]MCE9674697.1 hypothetical protein [Paraclostridium bifermentans]GKZ03741.1 hypothetical protein ANS014_21750 [Paraclostridium bifermentans]GKZ07616.1 hypothetical protein ANS015_24990 [Paraclostridium bifermentans]GKZ09970.1 hypothetical protein ANS017_13540 [Paraclostridium bifermentans]
MDLQNYKFEISHILTELNSLEEGNFYEVNENRGTPSAKTIAINIKKEFIDLLDKIANDKPGIFDNKKF